MAANRRERIEAKLSAAFSPDALIVADESGRHAGGPAAESHYNVTMVAAALRGQRSVQRHRLVYGALADELSSGLHALSLSLFAPEEVAPEVAQLTPTPACRGGA